MSSPNGDISDKIEEKLKIMKGNLENQLGGVSDKVYYQIRDSFSEVKRQIGEVYPRS